MIARIDELTDLRNLFEKAITSSNKKFSDNGPSIGDVKTFITNKRRGLTVTYAKAAAPVRSAQQQAPVANKSATSASQKAIQATPTQTVEAN